MTVMENLPFLSNDAQSPSRNGQRLESDAWPEPVAPEHVFQARPRSNSKDPFDFLKEMNPVGLILIGIVIGVMIISMRPIVVQSK